MEQNTPVAGTSPPELKPMSFIAACRTFFGLKPNESLQEFVKEIKDLAEKDKADLTEMFRSVGIDSTRVN